MTNVYAINTTRGREFEVEEELNALGVKTWVPRRLTSKKIKQKKERVWSYAPYVPKLIFCTFPAVYWPDVKAVKHVIGNPVSLSQGDIAGRPAYSIERADGTFKEIPRTYGLTDFKDAVEAEYADAERLRANNLYQCAYTPGQALEVLSGVFEDRPAVFREVVEQAHMEYAKLRVEVEVMGAWRSVELSPDQVGAMG